MDLRRFRLRSHSSLAFQIVLRCQTQAGWRLLQAARKSLEHRGADVARCGHRPTEELLADARPDEPNRGDGRGEAEGEKHDLHANVIAQFKAGAQRSAIFGELWLPPRRDGLPPIPLFSRPLRTCYT